MYNDHLWLHVLAGEILQHSGNYVCEKTTKKCYDTIEIVEKTTAKTTIVHLSIVITDPPPMYIYTHTNTNSALPPSLPVVHHLSLGGNPAHTEASQPIRRQRAPHAHRPLTP